MTTSTKIKRRYPYEPDYAVPPGETLSEVLSSLHMTQKSLATRTGLTEQTIVRILKGEQPISFETANRFELVTGVPARLWNNLEMQYREQLSKIQQRRDLERSVEWLRSIPTGELVARGVIPDATDKVDLLQATLKFYGVSSVQAWEEVWEAPEVAARRSRCFETQHGPASAWIRLGELQAQQIDCAPFDRGKFEKAVQAIRYLTRENRSVIQREMGRFCAEAGVALALVREMSKVPWNGATKWLSPQKAMVLLSLRGKGEDIFWFSFFHEADHVLHGKKQRLYIADKDSDDPEERKADRFAAETLIPAKHNARIRGITTRAEIRELAEELGISPGIVAGRFRHLTKRWEFFKDLTRTFKWGGEE
ncbi:helix-turn-helix domain-containing protein [bacterium]|nr:helix-turn-helix domain-containing protein [bacterium]